MRIGLVRRGHSATGGAEAYLIRLASGLASEGHDPVLITNQDWPEAAWTHSHILRLSGETPQAFAQAFRATDTGCDVHLSLERVPGCEVFRAGDGVHAAWLKRREGFEPWWKKATRWVNPKHKQLLELEREVFLDPETRAVIANSRLVHDEVLSHYPGMAGRVHVIQNGIATTLPAGNRREARAKFGIADDAPCALFVGTGWDRKGLRVAVDAVAMSKNTNLLVAGRGPADAFWAPRVKFVGPVRDLSSLFGAADLFVLPTYYDPFSNACLEALAAGLPVITTAANGFSEILELGIHGDIVPTGNARALAQLLVTWTPERCRTAATACRSRAAEFSIERNTQATLRVLESVAR